MSIAQTEVKPLGFKCSFSPARLAGRLLPVAVSVHLRTWMTGGTGGVEVPLSRKIRWSDVSLVAGLAPYLAWGLGSHVQFLVEGLAAVRIVQKEKGHPPGVGGARGNRLTPCYFLDSVVKAHEALKLDFKIPATAAGITVLRRAGRFTFVLHRLNGRLRLGGKFHDSLHFFFLESNCQSLSSHSQSLECQLANKHSTWHVFTDSTERY